MKYFKNSELARLYNVSEKTVRNWVKASSGNAPALEIYSDDKGRKYIADTTRNALTIQSMVQEGKKYVNSRTHKIIEPRESFYDTYSVDQIIDMVGHLERYHELPFQYCHMGEGARLSEEYYSRLAGEDSLNPQNFTPRFLTENAEYLLGILPRHQKVNVVEIGGRTGMVTKDLLGSLLDRQLLNKYIDLDISGDMIDRARKNIQNWFGKSVDFEGSVRDINKHTFDDILFNNHKSGHANLVLFLGGTLHNLTFPAQALGVIRDSLSTDDVFVMTAKLDTDDARHYFDFSGKFENQLLDPKAKATIELLNIDESFYNIEQFYDETVRARKIQIRLKFDVSITFKVGGVEKRLDFSKGQAILLWYYWHLTAEEIHATLLQNGFKVLQSAKSSDEQYLIITAKIRTDRFTSPVV